MSPEEERQRGLSRERLVDAALELVNQDGLDALSMRALADRLDVKAASLYWHVRDRRELLELLAESLLEGVSAPPGGSWRSGVLAAAADLGRRVSAQNDADRILLEAPEALRRSDAFGTISARLRSAGLESAEAGQVTLMALTHVIAGGGSELRPAAVIAGGPVLLAVDSGSRGVVLRAGKPDMQGLIQVVQGGTGAAPAVVTGDAVVVRRLRGMGMGELELNPRRPWRFKVQGSTWHTVLDAAGLDVREIHVDSGAAKLECFLPEPNGVVPLHVSSAVASVSLHRPRGVAVVVTVHAGSVNVRLDEFSTRVVAQDLHWTGDGGGTSGSRYELEVSSGVVDLRLDSYDPKPRPQSVPLEPSRSSGDVASALEILLDGVERRVSGKP